MIRRLVALWVALLAAWLGLAGPGAGHAAVPSVTPTQTYAYNVTPCPESSSFTGPERAPPGAYDHAGAHESVDRWWHGTLACADGPAPTAMTDYDTHQALTQVERAVGSTRGHVEVPDDRSLAAQPGVAAKAVPEVGDVVLYQKLGSTGEHLKYGITKNPATRYTSKELDGGSLNILSRGSKQEMLALERSLHETLPIGPQEGQLFYIQKQIANGLRPPPYAW